MHALADVPVDEVMVVPETTAPETLSTEAAVLMVETGYGCLPVVDNRNLVGIVTAADFVASVADLGASD